MFSVVVSTRRDAGALKPLFAVSDKDAEIIIIDSNYNEKTKEELSKIEHKYATVTYAPPMEANQNIVGHMTETVYKRDLVRCQNTGFSYADHEWIVKIDDCTELKPNFFDILREDISRIPQSNLGQKFVIRPVKLEQWSGHKQWDKHPLLQSIPQRLIVLGREGLGSGMFITLDQVCFKRDVIDEVNGNDERYDIGHGFEDADLMQRLITMSHNIIMDQELMTFQTEHWTKTDPIDFSRLMYEITKIEILNGRHWAYNPYKLKEVRDRLKSKKPAYGVSKQAAASISQQQEPEESKVTIEEAAEPPTSPDVLEIAKNIGIGEGAKSIEEEAAEKKNPNYFYGKYAFDQFFSPESLEENKKKIMALKDKHKGEDLFILGNSSDLTKEFIDRIRGKTTFAANAFVICKDAWNYEPTYFVVTNQGIFDNHLRNIKPEFTWEGKSMEGGSVATLLQQVKKSQFILSDLILKPAIIGTDFNSCSRLHERINFLKDNVHTRILNREELEPPYMIQAEPRAEDISFDLMQGTFMFGTVITDLMMPLAAWMGFKNIYLTALSGGEAHFYDKSPRNFWSEDHQKKIYSLYGLFKKRFNEIGSNLYNLDRPLTDEEVKKAEEASLAKHNPTETDGHYWGGPIYPTNRIIGQQKWYNAVQDGENWKVVTPEGATMQQATPLTEEEARKMAKELSIKRREEGKEPYIVEYKSLDEVL